MKHVADRQLRRSGAREDQVRSSRTLPVAAFSRPAGGFSLLELLLVMAVTLMLTALLLPSLTRLRENAYRVICSSNMRQTGMAVAMFADDHDGKLPRSFFGEDGQDKQEMMASHRGGGPGNWEGLGWLYHGRYLDVPEVLYCPSHTGDHHFERYHFLYPQYLYSQTAGPIIYTNYHYSGDVDWETNRRRRLEDGHELVIAADGLRTLGDFNHRVGMNVLRGDLSVLWRDDVYKQVVEILPRGDLSGFDDDELYAQLWALIQSPH